MKQQLNNTKLEKFCHLVSKAIVSDDAAAYEKAMNDSEKMIRSLLRWQIIAYRDRVNYLVENEKEIIDQE